MTTSTGRQQRCQRLTSKRSSIISQNIDQRRGLTLVEIMIALTVTLIVLGAMAQAFKFASGEIAQGRAILEIANRLRGAEQMLRRDLAGITVDVRPHTVQTPSGYFEYVEGSENDSSTTLADTTDGYLGDVDDFMAFTARNLDGDYRGRVAGMAQPLQSAYAEIVWYTAAPPVDVDGNGVVDFDQSITLFRRVLLIRPDLNGAVTDTAVDGTAVSGVAIVAAASIPDFHRANDLSARAVELTSGSYMMVANSIQDLAIRANRYAHVGVFPNQVAVDLLASFRPVDTLLGVLSGEDIVLSDIAAFDLRLYSPDAPVEIAANTAMNLNDVGFTGATTTATGDFIDIAPFRTPPPGLPAFTPAFSLTSPQFTTAPIATSGTWGYVTNGTAVPVPPSYSVNLAGTYCTWTPVYESDGIDQDGDGLIDEGQNGIDDNGSNGVDDNSERETAPPYPFAARGLKITLRVVEKNNRQVRQTSIIHKF